MVSALNRPFGTCGIGRLWIPALKCRAIFFASLWDAFGAVGLSLIRVGENSQTPVGASERRRTAGRERCTARDAAQGR